MYMDHCIPSIMSGTVNPTGHNELSHSKCIRVDIKKTVIEVFLNISGS